MKRPSSNSKESAKYMDYLEGKIKLLSSRTVIAKLYRGEKKILGDLADLLMNDIEVTDDETGEITKVKLMSIMALKSKDDKFFDRILALNTNLPKFLDNIERLEKMLEPEQAEEFKKEYGSELEEALEQSGG